MAFNCTRWTTANTLPVLFVLWIVSTIWILYVTLHLLPLLQLGRPAAERDQELHRRGVWEACVSQTLTALLLTCFLRAVFTDPGSVPGGPEWQETPPVRRPKWATKEDGARGSAEAAAAAAAPAQSFEVKQTGERRFCKWCDKYKPDRCHHCRVCRSCILRMDHHCPWIANCVGFRNHKFFFLLVFYAFTDCAFIVFTMAESVARTMHEEPPTTLPFSSATNRFLLVFGITLAAIMGWQLCMFFSLHVYLMLKASTTIEFCEKRYRRFGPGPAFSYDIGPWSNMEAVLGPNPLLWLLPLSPPSGDGLSFRVVGGQQSQTGKDAGKGSAESSPLLQDREGQKAAEEAT